MKNTILRNTISPYLRTKEIKSFINEILDFYTVSDFDSLDELQKDKFVSLCIQSLGCDVEVILGEKGNHYLIQLLNKYNRDSEVEIINALKQSVREQFGFDFELLLEEEQQYRQQEEYMERKGRINKDQLTGEILWV